MTLGHRRHSYTWATEARHGEIPPASATAELKDRTVLLGIDHFRKQRAKLRDSADSSHPLDQIVDTRKFQHTVQDISHSFIRLSEFYFKLEAPQPDVVDAKS